MAGLIDSTRSILLLVDFQIRLMPAILGGDAYRRDRRPAWHSGAYPWRAHHLD